MVAETATLLNVSESPSAAESRPVSSRRLGLNGRLIRIEPEGSRPACNPSSSPPPEARCLNENTRYFQRVFEERMKGLEPSTFCWQADALAQLSYIRESAIIAARRRYPRPRSRAFQQARCAPGDGVIADGWIWRASRAASSESS